MKHLRSLKISALLTLCVMLASGHGYAQTDEDSEIQNIESELEKNIPQIRPDQATIPPVYRKERETVTLEGIHANEQQLAIIQKNFMPKTNRYSISGGLTFYPSDVFFKTFGAQVRGTYHLNETWGIEGVAMFFNSSKSAELKDLESKQDVTASSLSTLKSYVGAQVYFNSMYGKYALNDRKIIPFEIYQTLGAGQVNTDKSNSAAITAGLGQMLSLSRDSALKFDLTVLYYQTDNILGERQQTTAFLITLAYTSFFPKAAKRW